MKSLQKYFSERFLILVLLIFFIPSVFALFQPGFFKTQDLIYVARLYEMTKSLGDGQFPVRWVADFRYGEPLYDFYAPLTYYVGTIFSFLSFVIATKILFGLGFFLSGLSMYFLSREIFGKAGGFLSAVLYVYAPYHSVDVYVRGALSESWALIFFPLIFLSSFKLAQKSNFKNLVFLSLSLAGLIYTHNIMTLLISPFFFGWVVYLFINFRKSFEVKFFLSSLILGFGLGASYLLPALFEKQFIQSNFLTGGYFDFRAHFVELKQFFSTFWGYGASVWGSDDGMSFQVGLAHWIILVLSLILTFTKSKKFLILMLFLILEFLFSLFMQHNKSTFIWLHVPLLGFTQFPWRFLGISIFFISLIGGVMGTYKNSFLVCFVLSILVVFVNIGYFHPDKYMSDLNDNFYISADVLNQEDRLPKDYLSIWVKEIRQPKIQNPEILEGSSKIYNFRKNSLKAEFLTESTGSAKIEVPITFFPGWQGFIDKTNVKIEPSNLGLITLDVPKGNHTIDLKLGNTPIRTLGNAISLGGLILVLLIIGRSYAKKN